MTKTQIKHSRLRKFFGWFGHHKVVAVCSVLLLGLVLFMGVTQIIWEVQVHSEKNHYFEADQALNQLDNQIRIFGAPNTTVRRWCSYTGDTGFGRKWLGCSVELDATYTGVIKSEALTRSNQVKSVLQTDGIKFYPNSLDEYFHEVSSSSFTYKGLSCSYNTQFYDESTPVSSRNPHVPGQGNAALITVNCGGAAKAEYFPVNTD